MRWIPLSTTGWRSEAVGQSARRHGHSHDAMRAPTFSQGIELDYPLNLATVKRFVLDITICNANSHFAESFTTIHVGAARVLARLTSTANMPENLDSPLCKPSLELSPRVVRISAVNIGRTQTALGAFYRRLAAPRPRLRRLGGSRSFSTVPSASASPMQTRAPPTTRSDIVSAQSTTYSAARSGWASA